MGSRSKRMVLQALNSSQSDLEENSRNSSKTENDTFRISDILLVDENMEPLISQSFIDENSVDISSSELCQILHVGDFSKSINEGKI